MPVKKRTTSRPPRRANGTGSQQPGKRHRGADERIATRRVQALDLRKAGRSYREIAARLKVDVSTAWDDVQAEMEALRGLATTQAEAVKELELQRLDRLLAKLEAHGLKRGDHRAVSAAVRISERRAKLLGLDAPTKLAGHDGGPLVPAADLSKLSPADLDALEAVLAKATPGATT